MPTGQAQRPARQLGGTVEQSRLLIIRASHHHELEQLPRDPEGHVALELPTASAQHVQPRPRSALARRSQQLRLADPSNALDRYDASRTAAGVSDQLIYSAELGLALQKRGGHFRPS